MSTSWRCASLDPMRSPDAPALVDATLSASMPERSALRLWLCCLAALVPAAGFARRYPLRGHTRELTDIGKLAHYHRAEFWGFSGGLLLLFALYALAIRETTKLPARAALPPVLICGALAVAVFAAMYPVNAIDLFIYAVRSRLWTKYGENPIAVIPRAHALDSWRPFASEWGKDVSPYGPLWNWIAASATRISGDNLGRALALLKGLAAVSIVLDACLVAAVAARLRPGRQATAAALFALNPMVLWEGAGNGHNDVVMMLPVLLALLLWARRRFGWVVPLLVCAALIKYVALLLIPLALVAIWRQSPPGRPRLIVALQSLAGSLAATLFALAPFFDVGAIRRSVEAQGKIVMSSPTAMAIGLWRGSYPVATIEHWSHVVGTSLFAAAFAVQIALTWRRPERLPRACVEVLFAYLLFGAWTFRNWYVLWLIPLVALLPLGWAAARTVTWSLTALAFYGLFIWGWEWWKVDFYKIQNVAVAMTFGPPLLLSGCEVVATLRRARAERARRTAPSLASLPLPPEVRGEGGRGVGGR